jgi:hypothetical protein
MPIVRARKGRRDKEKQKTYGTRSVVAERARLGQRQGIDQQMSGYHAVGHALKPRPLSGPHAEAEPEAEPEQRTARASVTLSATCRPSPPSHYISGRRAKHQAVGVTRLNSMRFWPCL